MLQNKANSTVLRPYFCSYFCLVCGGWGFKMIPHFKTTSTYTEGLQVRKPKMGKEKLKMVHGPKWEKRPKNGQKWKNDPDPIFRHFWAILFPMSGRGPFSFLSAKFLPFSAFGASSILCQAAFCCKSWQLIALNAA